MQYLDDGAQKPIRIWSRIGRRPVLAAGNSNGDIPVLEFTRHRDKPFLPLLLLHDDADREFAYTDGAEQAVRQASTDGWAVVSIENDWATVFPAQDLSGLRQKHRCPRPPTWNRVLSAC